jgi:hypothetical membrane protein
VSTILGLLNPDFDVTTEPVSALAWGPLGWVQSANFYALGASTIAFALGLYRGLEGRGRMGATILLSISGLALIVAGIFKSTPPGAESTPSGLIHGMAFFWTFIPLPTTYALAALRLKVEQGWGAHAVYSAAMPSVVFGLVVIYGVLGSDPGDPLFFVGGIPQPGADRARLRVGHDHRRTAPEPWFGPARRAPWRVRESERTMGKPPPPRGKDLPMVGYMNVEEQVDVDFIRAPEGIFAPCEGPPEK